MGNVGLVATVGAIALASGGCVGPPVLEQQVLGYDQIAKTLNEELLLLNIVSGEEFTRRIVTPFRDEVFQFLVFQGERIGQVMRLMAAGIEVQGRDGRFIRFIENDPERRREYEEFRVRQAICSA